MILVTEADAWEVKTSDESRHDSRNLDTTIVRHFTYIPAHKRNGKEPLYSGETIEEELEKFEERIFEEAPEALEAFRELQESFKQKGDSDE